MNAPFPPTVYILKPLTDYCHQWITDNLAYEPYQMLGDDIVIEHRFIDDIVALLTRDEYILGVDFSVTS